MATEIIDLRVPSVVPQRQPDPRPPTVHFNEKTQQSFASFVGGELLPEVVNTLNGFLSTRARADMQAKIQEKTRKNWSKYSGEILAGRDINGIVEESERDIRSFFQHEGGRGLHQAYWASVLQEETLQKHRAGLLQTAADDARVQQAQIIDRDYKTQWLNVDRDPSNIFDALDMLPRLQADVLSNTGDPQGTAQQMVAWADELALTAITRSAESSILGGMQMYGRMVGTMSIGAIKKAQQIMMNTQAEHTRLNQQAINMQESRERVDIMMRGADSYDNPVFIDPDNKQYQKDMENDYALHKLEAANGVDPQDIQGAMTQAIRSYGERVRRTGIIPDGYASDIRSHLNSGDVGLMKMAASDIENITNSGIKLSRKVDSQLIADSETIMRWARSGVSDDTILQRIVEYRKNRVEYREHREKAYGDTLRDNKNYVRDITRRTFGTRWGFTPNVPGEYQVAAAEAVKQYYTHQGMEFNDAVAAAARDLKQSWGRTTRLDGKDQIMLYPPEMAYPGPVIESIRRAIGEEVQQTSEQAREAIGQKESELMAAGPESGKEAMSLERYQGAHWTTVSLLEEMREWKPKKQYESRNMYLDFAGTDPQTEKIIYRVMYRNADGGIEEVLTERDGTYQPTLWYPSPKYFIKYYSAKKEKEKAFAEGIKAIHHGG